MVDRMCVHNTGEVVVCNIVSNNYAHPYTHFGMCLIVANGGSKMSYRMSAPVMKLWKMRTRLCRVIVISNQRILG